MRYLLSGFCFFSAILSSVIVLASIPAEAIEEHGAVLRRLEAEALAAHPSVLAAREKFEAASRNVDAARWQFFPTPNLGARKGDSYSKLTVGLSQPIYSGGRLTAQMDQALDSKKSARQSLSEVRFSISLAVINGYGSLIGHLRDLDIYRAGLKDLAALRTVIKKRVDDQISVQSDYLLTDTRYRAIEGEFYQMKSQVDIDYAHLSQLLGRAVTFTDVGSGFALAVPAPLQQVQDAVVTHTLAAHPQIRRLRAEHDAARNAVEVAKSSWRPNVSLEAEWDKDFPGARSDHRIEVVFGMDLGAGMSNRSRFLAAEAAQRAAAHAVSMAERALREELAQLFADYRASRDSAERFSGNVERLDAVLTSYKRSFLIGSRSWMDVLNMLREKIQAQVALANARAQLFALRERLERYENVGDDNV